jgi:DNA-binding NarL/FixJ family response regulator
MASAVRSGGAEGGDDVALALYQTVRNNGSTTPGTAEAELGLSDAEAKAGWSELRELGLIRPGRDPEEVASVEPDTALIELLARQRETLRAQREELSTLVRAAESLIDRYRPAVLRETAEIEVELLSTESPRRRQFIHDFGASVTTSIGSMHPGPLPSSQVLTSSLAEDREMIERGVRIRSIYGQSVNSAPRQRKYFADLLELGVELRLASHVPFDLLIADTHSALFPADPDNLSGPAVIVRGPALVRSYLALYEDCWLRAMPYVDRATPGVDPDHELTEQHRTTLRLLANGLTDERIARKLGVSLRTVSRLVSEVMRYLQADSRFQAGVLAAAQGLV